MGIGASKVSEPTEEQKSVVGPFYLRSDEKFAQEALSALITRLITKNNLFDMQKILNGPDGCNQLFIVVSKTIEKEFSMLRFPDPKHPSETAILSYIDKGKYDALQSDFTRRAACTEISRFIIRLVTLIAALTASVTSNPNISQLLLGDSVVDKTKLNKDIKSLPREIGFSRDPIALDVIEFLKKGGRFNQVDEMRNLWRFGKDRSSIVVDIKEGIVYNAIDMDTPVLGISMQLVQSYYKPSISDIARPMYVPAATATTAAVASSVSPYKEMNIDSNASIPAQTVRFAPATAPAPAPAAAPAPAPAAAPAPAPAAAPANSMYYAAAPAPAPVYPPAPRQAPPASVISNASTNYRLGPLNARTATSAPGRMPAYVPAAFGQRRRTRRGGGRRRRSTRRVGGAVPNAVGSTPYTFLLVTLQEFAFAQNPCTTSICWSTSFYMDVEGNTYERAAFEEFQARRLARIPEAKSFNDRVGELIRQSRFRKVVTVVPEERVGLSREKYRPLHIPDATTYARFKDIRDDIATIETGAAPAPYRAFLLASAEMGESITTYFCSDRWNGEFLTATLPFSLLQSLFNDGRDGLPTSATAEKCRVLVNDFIGNGAAVDAAPSGMTPNTLDNLRFAPVPKELDAFCAKGTSGERATALDKDKLVLRAAHRKLRELYNAHISDVVNIVRKILTIRTPPEAPSESQIRLSKEFVEDTRGAVVVLEKYIDEARTLIGNHYVNVENVYRTALRTLAQLRRGDVGSAASTAAPASKE